MQKIHVYEPKSQKKSFTVLIAEMFEDLFSSANLAKRIFIRDKKAEYRQSVLGILWAFITPFTNALVWIFLSASGAINIPGTGIPYPLFVFLGTMLWSIFTEAMNMPLQATTGARDLISKINFPKEAILLSGFLKMLFNTGIKVIILLGILAYFNYFPNPLYLSGFLAMLVFTIAVGYCIGVFITPVGMLYKDIGRLIPMALSFLMYLTPVVYKETKFGKLQKFIELNPLTPIINSARNLAVGEGLHNPPYLAVIFVASLIIGFLGWIFYRVSIPIIVERM